MRPSRLVTIAAAAAAATLTLGSAPLGAGEAPPTLPITVDPTSGPAGTEIAVSGAECPTGYPLEVGLIDPDLGYGVAEDFDQTGDESGNWSATLELPADAEPGTTYTVEALCIGEGAPKYEHAEFLVTEDEAPAVLPISVDPTSGPIGTTISVSGSDCPDADIEIVLLAGTSLYEWHAIVDYVWDITTGPDGTWSGELFVYDTMFELPADPEGDLVEVDVVPGDDYFVAAACLFEDGFVESDVVPFDITGDGTAPPRTDAPAVPGIGTPSAQPASPVVGDPTYTG
jgi:hypothetical protein